MPSWLALTLAIGFFLLWTALLAGGHTGRWRTVWEAGKQFAGYLALLAIPAALVGLWVFITS